MVRRHQRPRPLKRRPTSQKGGQPSSHSTSEPHISPNDAGRSESSCQFCKWHELRFVITRRTAHLPCPQRHGRRCCYSHWQKRHFLISQQLASPIEKKRGGVWLSHATTAWPTFWQQNWKVRHCADRSGILPLNPF